MANPGNLTFHIGQDYAVAMLPGEITENATVNFGRCQDDASQRKAKAFVRRFNSQPALLEAARLALDQLEILVSAGVDDKDVNGAIRAIRGAIRKART